MNNVPIKIEDMHMKGSAADANSCSLLDLLKVLIDNDCTLHRLHFQLSKKPKNNNDSVEHVNPANNEKINCTMSHEGNSKSANKKKSSKLRKQSMPTVTMKTMTAENKISCMTLYS